MNKKYKRKTNEPTINTVRENRNYNKNQKKKKINK